MYVRPKSVEPMNVDVDGWTWMDMDGMDADGCGWNLNFYFHHSGETLRYYDKSSQDRCQVKSHTM